MKRSREEEPAPDLPGSLWQALIRLRHTHPDPVGRTGPLARPTGRLSFTAATDTILAARVQMSGAETMGDLHETLRTLTAGLTYTHFARPDVALDVTLADDRSFRSTRHTPSASPGSSSTPLAPLAPATHQAAAGCFHCDGAGLARPLWEPATSKAWAARRATRRHRHRAAAPRTRALASARRAAPATVACLKSCAHAAAPPARNSPPQQRDQVVARGSSGRTATASTSNSMPGNARRATPLSVCAGSRPPKRVCRAFPKISSLPASWSTM